jgi:hypothetical protein
MDDLFLENLGEKIGLQNQTTEIRGAFSSIIWKDHTPLSLLLQEEEEEEEEGVSAETISHTYRNTVTT